jgi:formamidopyrimidine-DNA glycosylase
VPELPEVEVIRRDLAAEVTGRSIVSAQVRETPNAHRVIRRHACAAELEAPLAGATVTSVGRRGKFLEFHFAEDLALVVHLGMSGQLLHTAAGDPILTHTHAIVDLDDGSQLRFVDPRAFGTMFVTTAGIPELAHIGPDPLAGLTPQAFSRLLGAHRMKIKALLMDQRCVAGIGNIYSDEMLFLARLHPFRPCDGLAPAERRLLHHAMPQVLEAAIAHRGTSADDGQYRDLHGQEGEHRTYLAVYQREGQACRRCGAAIRRARWTNRSTHFCPVCQV